MQNRERRQGVAAGVLILALGLSVRFPITTVSPLLPEIAERYHLSASGLAVLSSIPVLLFGLASPLAPWLVARLGLDRAITVLLAALTIATFVRPVGVPFLFGGTVVVGAALALLGVLAPQLVRRSLARRAGFWTGVYTSSFGVSAAAGAALAIPVYRLLGERTATSLAVWGIPLLIATAIALTLTRGAPVRDGEQMPATGPIPTVFSAEGLWPVTAFFASQALIYFTLTAWLPTIAIDRGVDPAQAGLLLAWLSVAGLPASLLAPTLASRPSMRIPLVVTLALLSGSGLVGLAIGPVSLAPLMVAVLGVAQSAAFGLGVAFIVFTAPSAARTAAFSAVSQGIGYAFAAIGPLLAGVLAQVGLSWPIIVLLLTIASLGKLVFVIGAARASIARGRID